MNELRYEIDLFWSEEDQAYIAEVPELPGCMADGPTYEAALKAVPVSDHRFRVEHVQVLDHADVPRFAQLGVIPSMQAVHQTSDMYWASTRLGYAHTLGAYAWRSLLNTGVIIPNGSDFPVERVNPL